MSHGLPEFSDTSPHLAVVTENVLTLHRIPTRTRENKILEYQTPLIGWAIAKSKILGSRKPVMHRMLEQDELAVLVLDSCYREQTYVQWQCVILSRQLYSGTVECIKKKHLADWQGIRVGHARGGHEVATMRKPQFAQSVVKITFLYSGIHTRFVQIF